MMNTEGLTCFSPGQQVTVAFCGGGYLIGIVCGLCDDNCILVIKDDSCKCYFINLNKVKFIKSSACCCCCCEC